MSTELVTITDRAIEQIKVIMQSETPDNNRGLRLAVIGGGCSGLSYKIEFSEIKDKDNIFDYQDFKVVVDPKSSIYLKGLPLIIKMV
jgi:iron-sulfur cluster assembly protein